MFRSSKLRRRNPVKKTLGQRSGIATVEFAVCFPLLALICFGTVQLSSTILLRHKCIATLDLGTLDLMVGNKTVSELGEHIKEVADDLQLIDAEITVKEEIVDGENFIRVGMELPIAENLPLPIFVAGPPSLITGVLVYHPATP